MGTGYNSGRGHAILLLWVVKLHVVPSMQSGLCPRCISGYFDTSGPLAALCGALDIMQADLLWFVWKCICAAKTMIINHD